MSYIGNTPTQQNFVAGADQFSGNGSTTAFTLSRNVNTVFDIFVAISNVPQDPYSAYSVSGNTLTFTSAPPSGTGNIYVVYRATNVQTFVPTPGVSASFGDVTYTGTLTGSTGVMNIGSGQVYKDASGNVGIGTSSPANKLHVVSSGDRALKVTSNSDTPAVLTSSGSANAYLQMSGSADVYLGSVAGAFTATTGGSERMRIDSAGRVTMPYQPAFNVTSTVSLTTSIWTYNTTYVNRGSHMNISTGLFTAPIAGVYVFFFGTIGQTTHADCDIYLSVNGTTTRGGVARPDDTGAWASMGSGSGILSLNANDTVGVFVSPSNTYSDVNQWLHFRGFLLG